jgi:hypothetical protein
MEFKKSKLEIVRNSLKIAVMYAKTESYTAEFALLLLDVESAIIQEAEQEKRIEALRSLDGCPFVYCDDNPKCDGKCHYVSS